MRGDGTGGSQAAKLAEYLQLMAEVGLPDYRSTRGNRGPGACSAGTMASPMSRCSRCGTDLEAIRRFAGDDLTLAKYYDFDPDFLLELEPRVSHFEVVEG